MSQPMTQTEAALEEFRAAGVPVEKVKRTFISKKMTGFNSEVYSSWIERWAVNAAANFPVVKGSAGVAFLKNCAKNVPAVVVGIGPSLDQSIDDLKRAPRHAVIIATDAALRPLVRHGIKPDLVINFDARDHQGTMWETIDTSPFVLVATSVTSPHTIAAWKGAVVFFNMIQSDDEFATNILPAINPYIGGLPNRGTVGNGAIDLAALMGCKPIIGVGMDLCYSQAVNRSTTGQGSGKDEAPGAVGWRYRCQDWENRGPTPEFPDGWWVPVENKVLYDNDARLAHTIEEEIKGQTFKTDEPLKFYREALLRAIGALDLPFINCSGGVLEKLAYSMPLRKALEEKCYDALEPARTSAKHLRALVPAANLDWALVPDARIFIPKVTADLWSRTQKR